MDSCVSCFCVGKKSIRVKAKANPENTNDTRIAYRCDCRSREIAYELRLYSVLIQCDSHSTVWPPCIAPQELKLGIKRYTSIEGMTALLASCHSSQSSVSHIHHDYLKNAFQALNGDHSCC